MVRRATHSVPVNSGDEPVYATCPSCKRRDRVVRDGIFVTHDFSPYMRMVCNGSGRKPTDPAVALFETAT